MLLFALHIELSRHVGYVGKPVLYATLISRRATYQDDPSPWYMAALMGRLAHLTLSFGVFYVSHPDVKLEVAQC